MTARQARRALAAGATTLALVGLGLVGIASTANAVDTVPANPKFGGSFYLLDADTGEDIPESQVLGWGKGVVAIATPGDFTTHVPTALPPGAESVSKFIAPVGQESDVTKWSAFTTVAMDPAGQWLESTQPTNVLEVGLGTPTGQAAVAAAGGDFSIGFAYTDSGKLRVVDGGLFYVHIHVTAGTTTTATYTYERVEQEAAPLPSSTTTITTAPTSVTSGTPFSLTATVTPAGATGTVEFRNGSTSLGSAPVSGGTATLATATLANATSAAITAPVTAVYSGDPANAGSTSAAVNVTVDPGPITTTTTVTATSNSGEANRPVVLTANVSPVAAAGAGSVVFTGSLDGAAPTTIAGPIPVGAAGVATTTISSLVAGGWTIDATFTGVAPYVGSASTTPAALALTAVTVPTDQRTDPQDVVVTIPEGTLTITTPWTAADPLDLGTAILDDATSTYFTDPAVFGSATDQANGIQIIDRRAGAPGFTAQVSATDFVSGSSSFPASHLGLVNLAKHQVSGNTLQQADVAVTNLPANTPGLLTTAQTFATYGAGHATGTAWLSGDVELKGIPSSVEPGLYRATLTFTVL